MNRKNVRMGVDTGTYVTVISENCYNENFKNLKIVETGRKL